MGQFFCWWEFTVAGSLCGGGSMSPSRVLSTRDDARPARGFTATRIVTLLVASTVCGLLGAAAATSAYGADLFLTIGGGAEPASNQASLEKNALYLRRVLSSWKVPEDRQHLFFSDGGQPGRDLQWKDVKQPIPPAHEALALVFDRLDGIRLNYRTAQIPEIRGPATKEQTRAWFQNEGRRLKAGDRLFLYFTGHGGEADDKDENTVLYLWNDQSMKMTEFVGLLDLIPPEVPVVLVMVQCYSGGFANVIFNQGDPDQGPTRSRRCGFFATVADREAAGCTPDIDEEDYQEYSTYFWAALSGFDRLGKPIVRPDYDRDGKTTLAEAHAYVQIHADTADVPVSTSSALLRNVSVFDEAGNGLWTIDMPFSRVVATAGAEQREVVNRLSEQLKLTGENRFRLAERLAKQIDKQRDKIADDHETLLDQADELRKKVKTTILQTFPELDNPYHPKAVEWLVDRDGTVLKMLQANRNFTELQRLQTRIDALLESDLKLEKQWAKSERFLRAIEEIVMATNLERVARPNIVQRYRELLALERSVVGPALGPEIRPSP